MVESGKTSPFWRRLLRARAEHVPPLPSRQQDIAKTAGVYQSAVTKWKSGEGLPTLANCIALATEAGVCVEWLLTERGPMRPTAESPAETELLALFRLCDDDGQRWVIQTVKYGRTAAFTGDPQDRSAFQRKLVEKTPAVHEKPPKYQR